MLILFLTLLGSTEPHERGREIPYSTLLRLADDRRVARATLLDYDHRGPTPSSPTAPVPVPGPPSAPQPATGTTPVVPPAAPPPVPFAEATGDATGSLGSSPIKAPAPAPPAPPPGLSQATVPAQAAHVAQVTQAAEQRRKREALQSADQAAVSYRHAVAPLPWEVGGSAALLLIAGAGWTVGRRRRDPAPAYARRR